MGSGCGGSVGRAVASHTRGPQFESSQWQKFILNISCQVGNVVFLKNNQKIF